MNSFFVDKQAMATLKAKKLSNTEVKNSQLAKFVASLGVNSNLELYLCNDFVYINVDILLPVLLVDLTWFKKNAEIPTHYILVKKNVYINKYGMTKLLGQSKQPAAFMLQDYLYELFYKVETEGSANRDDMVSRKKLLALEDTLSTYKSIIERSQNDMEIAQEESKSAINDCAALEAENAKLSDQLSETEDENETLKKDLDVYKSIANNLAKYVRATSKKPHEDAFSEALDEDDLDEENADIFDDLDENKPLNKTSAIKKSLILEKKAVKAHALLKKKNSTSTSTSTSKTTSDLNSNSNSNATSVSNSAVSNTKKQTNYNIYYLMRSVMPADTNEAYAWHIADVAPSDELLALSEAFMSGEMIFVNMPDICYRKISLSEDKKNMILLFLELINNITQEQTIERLIT